MESAYAVENVLLHNYFHFIAIAVLYYDHLITLSGEISYLAFFVDVVVTCLNFITLSSKSCKEYTFVRQVLLIINQVLVCLLLTLRSYALYGRDWRILAFLVGGGAGLATAAAWSLDGQHSFVATNVTGCHTGSSNTTGIHLAVAWEALFVFDCMVFGLTVFKTHKARQPHMMMRRTLPLVSLVLRDGAFYFGIMALANFANILTFYLGPPLLKGGLSTFASSISVTMMSRLMLNLHQTAHTGILTRTSITLADTEEADIPIFTTRIAPMELLESKMDSDDGTVSDIRCLSTECEVRVVSHPNRGDNV